MKQSLYKYYLGSEGHNQYKYEMQKNFNKIFDYYNHRKSI